MIFFPSASIKNKTIHIYSLPAIKHRGLRGKRGGTRWKKVMRLTKGHICIKYTHRQQLGDGQREGVRSGWRQPKEGEMGTTVIVSNNESKV